MTPLTLAARAFREDTSVAAEIEIETAITEKPSLPCFLILPVMPIFVLLKLSFATNYSHNYRRVILAIPRTIIQAPHRCSKAHLMMPHQQAYAGRQIYAVRTAWNG